MEVARWRPITGNRQQVLRCIQAGDLRTSSGGYLGGHTRAASHIKILSCRSYSGVVEYRCVHGLAGLLLDRRPVSGG